MHSTGDLTTAYLRLRLARWSRLWHAPRLERRLAVEFSPRMRTALGNCDRDGRLVRLATWLRDAPRELLDEALCHEAAHAAVVELYGKGRRPHGPEWQRLMIVAGFEPRVRLPRELLPASAKKTRDHNASVYEHRCTVCHAYRAMRRPMHAWRCARCVTAGLTGKLEITSRPTLR